MEKNAPIWFRPEMTTVEFANARGRGTMVEHLGILVTEVGPDFLRATMPVDHRTRQPAGILHGGASVSLAETIGSLAANLVLDPARESAVGLEINANHLRAVPDGEVEGIGRPIHLGRTTQVWEIRISQNGKPTCISRLTLAVLQRKN